MIRPGENIVLIGMPGCGKSVIGKALATLSKRPLFDTDEMVEEMSGRPIVQIFADEGEAAFRAWECKATALAAGGAGRIIACGGGTLLNAENGRALSQNGSLYFIERDLELLPTKGRPLSIDIAALYAVRLPIYLKWAAQTIKNDASVEEAAQRVLAAHEARRQRTEDREQKG
jgi:shikimate dehydrogenase